MFLQIQPQNSFPNYHPLLVKLCVLLVHKKISPDFVWYSATSPIIQQQQLTLVLGVGALIGSRQRHFPMGNSLP